MAAVVEGKEGPRTEFVDVKIPPGNGDTSKPRLQIDQKFNTTVVLILSTPDFNSKCEVQRSKICASLILTMSFVF